MNKKPIRLTEQDLHRMVKESVNGVLNEWVGGGIGPNKPMQNNEPNGNTSRIAKYINKLYQQVGWFAEEFNKKGVEMLDNNGLYRVQVLQKLIDAIAQEIKNSSKSNRERENIKKDMDY